MTLTLGHIGKATGRDATSSIHTSHIIIYLPPNDISKPWLSHFIGKLNDLVTSFKKNRIPFYHILLKKTNCILHFDKKILIVWKWHTLDPVIWTISRSKHVNWHATDFPSKVHIVSFLKVALVGLILLNETRTTLIYK